MRTTVNIDDGLLRMAKAIASRTRRPLGEVVDDGLRMLIGEDNRREVRTSVDLPVFDGVSGLQPGVDLEDKEALMELLDLPDPPDEDARAAG